MKVLIHVNNAAHQREHAAAMQAGLARHGIAAEFVPRRTIQPCDIAVIWGWKPPEFIESLKVLGVQILVMERGYFPNRMEWSSLGWNGLNNRAAFPKCADNGERFRENWPDLLKPWKDGRGEYILVCGQVPGDAAVYGLDLDAWAQSVVDKLLSKPMPGTKAAKWDIVFRPHPLLKRQGGVRCPRGARLSTASTLEEDLADAKVCITYNSNSGVEAVCAGVPTVTLDPGAMAWDVSAHAIDDRLMVPPRESWANRLAWCQWRLPEIADGTAFEYLKSAIPILQEVA